MNTYRIDPTEYADPLFGVGSATSAGPTLPSGSIHPSPETLEKDCGGYLRNQPIIGFGNAFIHNQSHDIEPLFTFGFIHSRIWMDRR